MSKRLSTRQILCTLVRFCVPSSVSLFQAETWKIIKAGFPKKTSGIFLILLCSTVKKVRKYHSCCSYLNNIGPLTINCLDPQEALLASMSKTFLMIVSFFSLSCLYTWSSSMIIMIMISPPNQVHRNIWIVDWFWASIFIHPYYKSGNISISLRSLAVLSTLMQVRRFWAQSRALEWFGLR